ncbi:MAG: hypothetical protein ACM34I_00595, partial [bacterium]
MFSRPRLLTIDTLETSNTPLPCWEGIKGRVNGKTNHPHWPSPIEGEEFLINNSAQEISMEWMTDLETWLALATLTGL